MNILWIKDGKKGHEKQVKALLDELSKTININIYEEKYHASSLKRFFDILHHATSYVFKKYDSYNIRNYHQNNIHLLVGAGSNIHTRLLLLKKALKDIYDKDIIAISVLTPSLFKNEFDFICAPNHDEIKLGNNINNIIFFEGSLAKVSIQEPDDNIGFIALGGVNKHFIFNENDLIKQIEYVLTLYPKKVWYLFSSRRTTELMINKINILSNSYSNIIIDHESFDEIIKRASIKFITQDSMNMVYESLSTKGQTFVFNMKYKNENKITKQIKELLENKQIGYIENISMSDGLKKIKIQPQNPHYEVFAEVEKLSFQLAGRLKALK
jgi:mitochondrial fission protein ELM1